MTRKKEDYFAKFLKTMENLQKQNSAILRELNENIKVLSSNITEIKEQTNQIDVLKSKINSQTNLYKWIIGALLTAVIFLSVGRIIKPL